MSYTILDAAASFNLPPSLINTGEGVTVCRVAESGLGEACKVLFVISIGLSADAEAFTLHISYAVSEIPVS